MLGYQYRRTHETLPYEPGGLEIMEWGKWALRCTGVLIVYFRFRRNVCI